MTGRFTRPALLALLCSALLAPAGHAADRIYWANSSNNVFSFANLAGGDGDLSIAPGPSVNVNGPTGLAIDSATGKLYWGNYSDGERIAFANFDGSGAANLNTLGASGLPNQASAWGVALDPVGRRIYWANEQTPEAISFANLDGSGGGDVNTAGATVSGVEGVTVDPVGGRVYWGNNGPNKVSYANLDGTGGGDINTTGATVNGVDGVAVDPGAGRIYWAQADGVSFARLDGTGGADLNVTGATVYTPTGVSVDPAGGRVYWANSSGNFISFAKLDGSGGGDLAAPESTLNGTVFPVLLDAPSGTGAPAVSGGSNTGSMLSCSRGTWTDDLIPAFLYRAPHSFAFQWSRDGKEIPGATSSSVTASSAGDYGCRVTGSNPAGAATQTSASHTVSPGFGIHTLVTLKLASARVPAAGPLRVRVANANGFRVTGKLSGQTTGRVSAARKLRVKLKSRSFRVAAKGKVTVKLALPKALRRLLAREHELKLRLTAKVKDPAGTTRTLRKRVTPKQVGARSP